MEKKKIIITGGSGFIGTNLMEKIIESGDFGVMNIDIKSPRNPRHKEYWEKVDITDLKELREIVLEYSPDYIVHLGARTDIKGNSIDGYKANTIGVENMIEVANEVHNLRKIVLTSSMLVSKVGYKMKDICDYMPPNAYGESKVETENIIRSHSIKADWCILRPTSIWGEWFDTYRDFFEMVMNGKYMHFGKKSSTKTYGYVGNVVYQIESLLFADTSDRNFEDRIFYLGDRPAYNIEDWANEIAKESGKRIPRIPFWMIQCAAYVGDILKMIGISFPMTSFRLKNMTTDNIIDVDPVYSIAPNPPYTRAEAIQRTMQWIRNNHQKQ